MRVALPRVPYRVAMVAPLLWGLAACADDPASRQILAPEFAKPAETDPCEDLTLTSVYPGPSSLLVTVVNATTGVPLTSADKIVVKVGHRCFGLLDADTIDANGQATFGLQAGVQVFIGAQQIDLDAALVAAKGPPSNPIKNNFWPKPGELQSQYSLELAPGRPFFAGALAGLKKNEFLPFTWTNLVLVGNNPPIKITGQSNTATIALKEVEACLTLTQTDCVREYAAKNVDTGASYALGALNVGFDGTAACDAVPWLTDEFYDSGEYCGVFTGVNTASNASVGLYSPNVGDCRLEAAQTFAQGIPAVPILGSADDCLDDGVAASFMACSITPNNTSDTGPASVIYSVDGADPTAPFDIGTVFLTTGVTNGSWPVPQPSQLPIYVVSGTFGAGVSAATLTVKSITTGPGIKASNNITIAISDTPDGGGDGVSCGVSSQTSAGASAFCVEDPNNPGVVLVNIIESIMPPGWTLHEVKIDGQAGETWPNPAATGGNPDVDLLPYELGAQTYCPILDGGGKVGIGF